LHLRYSSPLIKIEFPAILYGIALQCKASQAELATSPAWFYNQGYIEAFDALMLPFFFL
jgi:hypothetical protein